MKNFGTLVMTLSLSALAYGEPEKDPAIEAVLEECAVLDQSVAQQANLALNIERLSTPNEVLLKEIAAAKTSSANTEDTIAEPAVAVITKSFAVHAQTFDQVYTLLTCWSLDVPNPTKVSFWSNITGWNELVTSNEFEANSSKYQMMIFPVNGIQSDDTPEFPVNLPQVSESGAYFQPIAAEAAGDEVLNFLEALHLFHDQEKVKIQQKHADRTAENNEKKQAKLSEEGVQKAATLRFWRKEASVEEPNSQPSE